MLDTNSLLAFSGTSRAAAAAVGPYLVKNVNIIGRAEKIISFCSFALSRRLAGKIQKLTLYYTSSSSDAEFTSNTAIIVRLLTAVLEGASSLRSLCLGDHAIYMFTIEPRLCDILEGFPSLTSLAIWENDMISFNRVPYLQGLQSLAANIWWPKDPAQYPAMTRFMTASASTLTRLELHLPRPLAHAKMVPLLDANKITFPQLRVLHLISMAPALTAKEVVLVFPNVQSLTVCYHHGIRELFEDLEPDVQVWPHLTTIKALLRFILLFTRRYQQPLRSVVLKHDSLEKSADCEEFLDSIKGCPVQRLTMRLEHFKYIVSPPVVVDEDEGDDGSDEDDEDEGDEDEDEDEESSADDTSFTAVWLFTNIASALPDLRILDLSIGMGLYGETNSMIFFEAVRIARILLAPNLVADDQYNSCPPVMGTDRVDKKDFHPTLELIAQRLFRATSARYLSLDLFFFPACTTFTQYRRRSAVSDGCSSYQITLDEYREAKRTIRREIERHDILEG
ncbi:hypothetical protein EVG20_g426 [Dentipellis fragilis]|uniref:F-box domain-containing protein n=1 Tax=Dentipellis fragilis TaxID=205917 RepID=A0A4Y9ZF05_9AGAM|nr:hypothetical protein EVG20_g426 [Dentipellis fragilis]